MNTPKHAKSSAVAGPTASSAAACSSASQLFTTSASKHHHSMRAHKQKSAAKKKSSGHDGTPHQQIFKPALASSLQQQQQQQQHQAAMPLPDSIAALRALTKSLAASFAATGATASAASPLASTSVPQPRKRKRDAEEDGGDESSHAASPFPGLCIGVNSVTRALSANRLTLVVVCRSVQPSILVAHLPILAHLHRVPILNLHQQCTTLMLAQAIDQARISASTPTNSSSTPAAARPQTRRIKLVSTIGIQRESLPLVLSALLPLATIPHIPWLPAPSPAQQSHDRSSSSAKSSSANPVPELLSSPSSAFSFYAPVDVLHTENTVQKKSGASNKKEKQQQKKPKQHHIPASTDTAMEE